MSSPFTQNVSKKNNKKNIANNSCEDGNYENK
jgi:hypothetical protein